MDSVNNHLPPGLSDSHMEIWADENMDIFILKDGRKQSLNEIDKETKQMLYDDMLQHPFSVACLNKMGFIRRPAMLKQYLACRYGNFDHTPDFTSEGNTNSDYFNCGKRGSCRFEGKLCDKIKVAKGYLTKTEIHVVQMMALDLPDKQIAEILGMAENTLKNHKAAIFEKMEVHSKVGMASFAFEHSLI